MRSRNSRFRRSVFVHVSREDTASKMEDAREQPEKGRDAGTESQPESGSGWLGLSLAAAGLFGGLGLADLLFRRFQHRQTFGPTRFPQGSWDPHREGVPVHNILFPSEDGVRLHGWWLRRPEALGTVLYFHGSGGHLGEHVEALQALSRLPVHVFAFDYRGYGRSEGEPSEEGLYRDGRAALRHLMRELEQPPQTVLLYGHSLGGAVAIDTALHHPAAGLVVQSSFTDVKGMARALFPSLPLHWVARNGFRSIDKVGRLELPKLFVHGTADTKVPSHHSRALFEAAEQPKELFFVEGADHGDLLRRGGLSYLERLERFLAECVG